MHKPFVLMLAALTLTSCANGPEREVTLPPVTADPETVVRAYVDALDARDIDTARALLTTQQAALVEGAEDSWFTNTESIDNLDITAPVRVEPSSKFPQHAAVYVQFDLTQEHEMSMDNGRQTWGYFLTRGGADERWLIDNQGVG